MSRWSQQAGALPREAMEGRLERFHAASYGWALACCAWDRDSAEEILQSAYLRALDGRAQFAGQSSLRTWFFGVVKRTALEKRRQTAEHRERLARWFRMLPEPEPPMPPDVLSDDHEVQRRLQVLLLRLSPRQRELLHLVFYQEQTIEESAQILGITVGSARTHYERGKARLREWLSPGEAAS